MIIYLLEWGLDEYYTNTIALVDSMIFPTIEDACSRAMGFEGNMPSIIKYDLETHQMVREWTDIPALNTEIGIISALIQ